MALITAAYLMPYSSRPRRGTDQAATLKYIGEFARWSVDGYAMLVW